MEAFEKQDVPVAIETDDAQLRTTEAGDITVAFMTLKQGADFGPALQGLPDDKCQCPPWGYMLRGRLRMTTNDGEQVYEARSGLLLGSRPLTGGARGLRVRRLLAHGGVPDCDQAHPGRRVGPAGPAANQPHFSRVSDKSPTRPALMLPASVAIEFGAKR